MASVEAATNETSKCSSNLRLFLAQRHPLNSKAWEAGGCITGTCCHMCPGLAGGNAGGGMGGGADSRWGGVLPRLRSVLLDLRRPLERSLARSLERESELLRRLRRLLRDSVPKGGINGHGYIHLAHQAPAFVSQTSALLRKIHWRFAPQSKILGQRNTKISRALAARNTSVHTTDTLRR